MGSGQPGEAPVRDPAVAMPGDLGDETEQGKVLEQ